MNLKKTLSALLLAAATIPALNAQMKIVIVPPEGEQAPAEADLTVDTKVTFDADAMTITNGSEVASIPYSLISAVKFDSGSVAVGEISSTKGSLRLRENPVANTAIIDGWDGNPTRLTINSLSGQLVADIKAWNGEELDVTLLSPGAYIININHQAIKFIKK